jgi:integrase
VETWAHKWMGAREPALKPKTAEFYRSLVRSRILPVFGEWELAELGPSDVQGWVGSMQAEGVGPSRIRHAHVTLSLLLGAAVREGVIARNVATGVELPPIAHREANYLTPGDVARIAEETRPPFDLMVRVMGALGASFGEAAALRRRSVDILRRRLIVEESVSEVRGRMIIGPTKTHAARRVPLTPTLTAALEDHLGRGVPADPSAFLFSARDSGPVRYSNFRTRQWGPALRRADLPPVGVHILRHSAAAALIASGASPKATQSILGHRSAAFTLTVYGHLFDVDLDEVARRLDVTLGSRGWDRDGTTLGGSVSVLVGNRQ